MSIIGTSKLLFCDPRTLRVSVQAANLAPRKRARLERREGDDALPHIEAARCGQSVITLFVVRQKALKSRDSMQRHSHKHLDGRHRAGVMGARVDHFLVFGPTKSISRSGPAWAAGGSAHARLPRSVSILLMICLNILDIT